MLSHISIQNYVLIDKLDIQFSEGFSVITGETGAGKSILLGALDLILGSRADTSVLRDKKNKCIIEGTFNIEAYALEGFFKKNDLDFDKATLLRREIIMNGKSRAFINDTPVTLSVLKELGQKLVDIHSQHQNLSLTDSAFQFTVIDSVAGILNDVSHYKVSYKELQKKIKAQHELLEKEKQSSTEKDYYEFVLNEIEEAKLLDGEQEKIEEELKLLDHAEEIKTVLYSASHDLENEETGILSRLSKLRNDLQKISAFSDSLKELSNRLDSTFIELSDVLSEAQRNEAEIVHQPGRAEEINDRLNILFGLQTKHRVGAVSELLVLKKEIELKLKSIQTLEHEINTLEKEIKQAKNGVRIQAEGISNKRQAVFEKISNEIEPTLNLLGMPDANFKVYHSLLNELGPDGIDKLQFQFNANKGGELQELSTVASGGEKSRLMLAVKSLVSKKILQPTIIFDEIDTGVSGAVADKVGNILLSLSNSMQVLAISHLPQIAGKGNDHFLVYKENNNKKTKTKMKKLNPDERIFEIAKLLSGHEVTSASVESAKHLLKN